MANEEKNNEFGASLLNKTSIDRGETTYRIISKSVSEYHFIVPFDLPDQERVEVGQIFSIKDQDQEKGRMLTFLARVLDVQHGSNYDGNWDTTLKGTQFFDQDQIFNRVIAEPLGCVRDGSFKKSRTIPTKFSSVSRAEQEEFQFLRQVMGDIEIGYLRNGSRLVEDIPVALHSDSMDHHMGVFATTGMGKSNFMKVFAASCMRLAALGKSKFGLLIVDPHGEYILGEGRKGTKGLMHLNRYSSSLACYSTDYKNCQMPRVEEFSISVGEIKPEDVALLYAWSPPQMDALDAISRTFDSDNWLDEIQDGEGLGRMVREGFKEGTIQVLVRRIKNLLEGNGYIKKRSSLPNILANLRKGNVVLVDIPRMSDRAELFLLSVLSRHVLEEYKKDAAEDRKNCLITIEEAQRVLGQGSNTSRFETIAREGRKFGVGLCAITQQPKLIDKQLLSQFNTLVVMGLGDRNDRLQLEESAKQDLKSLDIEIQTLEKGEAVISTLGIPFPVPVSVHKYEHYLERLKEEKASEESLISGAGFKPFLE
jgi:DNA helicase HerA-like ATPase